MRYEIDQVSSGAWGGGGGHDEADISEHTQRIVDDIWAANAVVPEHVDACVHGLIKRSVCERPSAPAICAWDGDLSYKQLDQLSSRLAHHLLHLGVGPGAVAMLCFEKSCMAPVAVLAVIKAGAASVAVDPTQLESRLRAVAAHVSAAVVLASPANEQLARRLGSADVVLVDRDLLSDSTTSATPRRHHELPVVSPSDILYLAFAPGHSEPPKGAIITHSNVCSAIVYQQRALGLTSDSRVLDLAPTASHLAWANMLHTLTCGGCLCIPSDADRQRDVKASLLALRANHVHLSQPDHNEDVEPAAPRATSLAVNGLAKELTVQNTYAWSETTALATVGTAHGSKAHETVVGPGAGICAWVVQVDNPDSLAPIGATGELCLEGPLVGPGYFKNPQQTADAFVHDPKWLLRGTPRRPGRRGRLYRTGDLVRYRHDGSLVFVGRKERPTTPDQRVEISEVEDHMRQAVESAGQGMENLRLIAETIQPQGADDPILVAFVAFDNAQDMSDEECGKATQQATAGLTHRLEKVLPAHMVPVAYIPIQVVPTTATGKTDRQCLRSIGSLLTTQEVARLRGDDRSTPHSETERRMRALWAEVLQLDIDSISMDHSFFDIGGDATAAMRLGRVGRDRGLFFSVRDVFQSPRLRDLSALASSTDPSPAVAIPPFSLLGSYLDQEQVRAQAAQLCRVQASEVHDVLPCSPLQEGLLALTQRQPGSYVAQNVYEIDSEISISKLRAAWDQVVAMNPILRTRIVSLPSHGLVQVVLEQGPQWGYGTDLNEYQRQHDGEEHHMGLGTPLTKFAIIDPGSGRRPYLLWEIHHALYDGWSMPLISSEAEHAYYNEPSPTLESMAGFIKYIQDRDETTSRAFWRAQFADIQGTHFPSAKAAALRSSRPCAQMSLNVSGLGWGRSDFTPATMARAAWAVVAARAVDSNEALYGITVTGRQAAVPGIETMAGPAIATVPIRVTLDWEGSVNQLLDAVQRQATDMIPFEQTGLQRIRRMGEAAATACGFRTLLVVQPAEGEGEPSGRPFLSKPSDEEHAGRERDFATYAIEVECQLGVDEARLRIDFDSGIVGQQEMERIARSFEQVLRQLADKSHGQERLGALAPPSHTAPRSIDDVRTWNAHVPEAVQECVHSLFAQRVSEHPQAPAIRAWDGDLTYQQLDERSTRLAWQLAARGVAGTLVPLLFEKSLWMPVTVLAVLKAGGALVALDMKHPVERLRAMASQADAPVLLASVQNASLACRVVAREAKVMVVGSESQAEDVAAGSDHSASELPAVSPASLLYVVFTSGSTGTPKGVMISHSNFCTALAHQQKQLDYHGDSRVLDFASCAFDVAWSNLFFTLTAGACLCIPSALERENDLAGCLVKYDVTLSDFTPSLARAIGPGVLSRLSTMILGGEASLPSDASLAGQQTHVINAYGPAECTPTTLLATLDASNVCIGRGAGVCVWVVEPDDADSLALVGAIGELWLEGPLVGLGYLNDPEKTTAAFIHDPVWLSQLVGRRGRVYRTGDLVRYQDDGTLVYVGRKDTQVKIRGQRVELGEVEASVGQALETPNVQVVAEVIQPSGANNPILVAFVTLPGAGDMTEEAHSQAVQQMTDGLNSRLVNVLPSYMIPAAYIPVHEMPVTTAGKTDRRRLAAIGASAWMERRSNGENGEESAQPTNEVESVLQKVWMSVLNLSAEEASIDAPFATLGGDSISAMQLVSRSRLHNLVFTVGNIFQMGTIRKLAARCQPVSDSPDELLDAEQEVEDPEELFELSPVQQSFFDIYPEGLNHYNQSFLLDLGNVVPADDLHRGLQELVARHAMLRARFDKDPDSGFWKQRVAEHGPESFAFADHTVEHREQVGEAAQWRQENLDIRQGPVFACDLFNLPDGGQIVVLSAHHLVIDLVSWRIMWSDIEDFIKNGEIRSQKTLSFRTWSKLQARMGRNLSPLTVLPYPIPEPQLHFWGLSLNENTFGQCDTVDVTFDSEVSKLIFGPSNDSLRTEAVDLILGAAFHSFRDTFPERPVPVVWVEGHGREQLGDLPTDVSGTVGWFTTLYPLAVSVTADHSVTEAVRLVKDTRKKVPGKGLPFFACRYHSESGRQAFQGHDVAEVVFNFTGRYQQLERDDGLFKISEKTKDADLHLCEISRSAQRPNMMDLDAAVSDGQLSVSLTFHQGMKHQDRLRKWFEALSEELERAARNLARAPVGFTLSDLPLLQLSYRGLDALLYEQLPSMGIKPSNVVDIYPCSPLQEGMLLSSVKGAASYATSSVWRCVPAEGDTGVSPSRLEAAWKTVVGRHTILSTVFALHPEGNGFVQIVLNQPPIRVVHVVSGQENPGDVLSRMQEPSFASNEPEHVLTICRSEAGEVACRLDMSHALTDAHSSGLLTTELVAAYEGTELAAAPAFVEMIRYINSTPRAQIMASWTGLLDGLQPCEFPVSSPAPGKEVRETFGEVSRPTNTETSVAAFCKKSGIMSSAFLQVAWAMVLSHFTGTHDLCFGYMTSGRDALVDKVDNLVGPLANMLVSRVDLRAPARRVLESTSDKSKQHLAIQHVSLAEIQHQLGLSGRRLFNTTLSIRGAGSTAEEGGRGKLSFETVDGEDAHEYDLKFSASLGDVATDVAIEYRAPYVSRQVAEEVCNILCKAFDYLLAMNLDEDAEDSTERDGKSETLFDGFFKHIVGAEHASATSFWKSQLAGTQASHFPALRAAATRAEPSDYHDSSLSVEGLDWTLGGEFTADTMIRAAWSVLTARVVGLEESIFGAAVISARQVSAVLPIRVVVNWEKSIHSLLSEVQRQTAEMTTYQQMGLERIRRLGDEAAAACNFQTLLAIYPPGEGAEEHWPSFGTCAMVVRVRLETGAARIDVKFDPGAIEPARVSRITHGLEHVLRQLLDVTRRQGRLRHLTAASQRDLDDIRVWNASLSEPQKSCVHDLFIKHATEQPDAPAIDAWDGNLTYGQLHELSSRLASHLVSRGVGPGSIVPLCFEKSMWMAVSAYAVMKTGGASVAIDSSQPEERLRTITTQVFGCSRKPLLLLSSVANEELAGRLGPAEVVLIGRQQLADLEGKPAAALPTVSPSDVIYVVYTSGSTGQPKGVVITHQNFSSAIANQGKKLGFVPGCRVLDFASYAFDVVWLNVLKTLTSGGCLCVPSASEREDDLVGCLSKYRVTAMDVTPSMVRVVEPKSALLKLTTVVIGGEAVLPTDGDVAPQVTVAYGPAECTPTSTILDLTKHREASGIGRAAGSCTWLVDVENPDALAPVGAAGELCIEGPIVGQGYLNEPEKTAAVFIQDPVWLWQAVGRRGRVYRTGDLVQYKEDGSLIFVGRKDTQVKIRGQRVELGDIEHHARRAIETSAAGAVTNVQVVAETIQPQGAASKMLVAFVATDNPEGKMSAEEYDSTIRQATTGASALLAAVLPVYMVPSIYIPIAAIPMSTTGKVDRRRLQATGAALTNKDVAALSRTGEARKAPQTDAERDLQALWAEILNMETESISADDSFFRIGGDSIGAMRLVGMARYKGFSFTVRDVFSNPVLRDLAAVQAADGATTAAAAAAGSLAG